MKIYKYNPDDYMFAYLIQSYFNVVSLTELYSEEKLVDLDTDQSTYWHKKFYTMPDTHLFFSRYREFIKKEICPLFNREIIFQKKPTFRVHLPNNLAVGEFHKDKDYNHNPREINIFLPFTKACGNNTIWTESAPDKGDYQPINLNYGEFAIFDGANCMHGNKLNDTGQTRVSIDFRVLMRLHYEETGKKTVTQGREFKIGDYYDEFRN